MTLVFGNQMLVSRAIYSLMEVYKIKAFVPSQFVLIGKKKVDPIVVVEISPELVQSL